MRLIFVCLLVFGSISSTDIYGQAASNLVAGTNLEATVQQILDMGGGSWDRETVVRALRAAYNNPERAVDYLYSVSLFLKIFHLCSFYFLLNICCSKRNSCCHGYKLKSSLLTHTDSIESF